jgi:hypothetical protein
MIAPLILGNFFLRFLDNHLDAHDQRDCQDDYYPY